MNFPPQTMEEITPPWNWVFPANEFCKESSIETETYLIQSWNPANGKPTSNCPHPGQLQRLSEHFIFSFQYLKHFQSIEFYTLSIISFLHIVCTCSFAQSSTSFEFQGTTPSGVKWPCASAGWPSRFENYQLLSFPVYTFSQIARGFWVSYFKYFKYRKRCLRVLWRCRWRVPLPDVYGRMLVLLQDPAHRGSMLA